VKEKSKPWATRAWRARATLLQLITLLRTNIHRRSKNCRNCTHTNSRGRRIPFCDFQENDIRSERQGDQFEVHQRLSFWLCFHAKEMSVSLWTKMSTVFGCNDHRKGVIWWGALGNLSRYRNKEIVPHLPVVYTIQDLIRWDIFCFWVAHKKMDMDNSQLLVDVDVHVIRHFEIFFFLQFFILINISRFISFIPN
jgi:hypothetical protein